MNHTFFALVNIPKVQQKGSANHSSHTTMHQPMECPEYESEAAVTRAIANGTFKGNANEAYRLAKEWEKYQKELNRPKFFPRKQATANRNGKYNHVMFGMH